MTQCQFCDHVNPRGAMKCASCGAELPGAMESANASLPAGLSDVLDLIRAGKKIEAIKVYRQLTGLGLAEAKDEVEAIERGQAPSAPIHAPADNSGGEQEVLSQLEAGNLIGAIKAYRAQTGLGLKESKDAVEQLARQHGITPPKAGCAGMLLGALFTGALAAALANALT